MYKDVGNTKPPPTRYENVTGSAGVTLRLKGYFCKRRLWDDGGLDFFYFDQGETYSGQTYNGKVIKPEIFTAARFDIGKKRILEKLKIEVKDYLLL